MIRVNCHSYLKFRIGVSPDVEVVQIGELPRFEGKAKRVIREA